MTVLEPITAVWGGHSHAAKGDPPRPQGRCQWMLGACLPVSFTKSGPEPPPPPRAPSCPHRGP